MKIHTIAKQKVTETEDHLIISLDQPYWGAWKAYGWEQGIEGIGLSVNLVAKAKELNKKIMVKYKLAKFEIDVEKVEKIAEQYQSYFTTRYGTKLFEIPRTGFTEVKA